MNEVTDILTRHMENLKSKIQSRMNDERRNASGRSSTSLSVQIMGQTGMLFGSSSFRVMETGRGPGKVPYGFFEIIRQWIKDKGISVTAIPSKRHSTISPEERGIRSLAGAIAYTIMKKGSRLHRDHKTDEIYSKALEEELALMADEFGLDAIERVTTINNIL